MGTVDGAHGTVVSVADCAVDVAVAMPVHGDGTELETPERSAEHQVCAHGMIVVAPPVVVAARGAHGVARTGVVVRIEANAAPVAVVTHVPGIPDAPSHEKGHGCVGVHVPGVDQSPVDRIDGEKRIACNGIEPEVVAAVQDPKAEGTGRARGDGMEIADTVRPLQPQVEIVVVVRKPVCGAAENEPVVRVARENDFGSTLGVDRVYADVAVAVCAEIDFKIFVDGVNVVLIAVGPEIDAESVVAAHDGTNSGEGAAERRRLQQRHQSQADSEDENKAFHGRPPWSD